MSMMIAALMFVPLLAVALAHLLWSMGRTWPIRDEKLLAQTVTGFKGVEHMPPKLASLAVAIATLAAGIVALSLADHDSGGIALTLLGLPLAAIFLGRGAIGYTQRWAEKTPHPSFRYNDRRVYSPLCLALGIGFAVLTVVRLL
ncbi:DUF3995 domain-containing protein [Devosia rhodophyticola]|uniref:DUF3995 domain-containing protein n=1 Tax=Devosia rhodophyticola TaxID=3026423 RepID=A0ABY7YWT2_9HYPH|nr:DUF3995 domain-containing protein [Devosia rhodophyticola]WDR05295.1 DUF3995 domain-containing protein [Devosia rhodophyticola]